LSDLSEICRAVAYWLNYKDLTGLHGLFSEASLTVPIAEHLKTKGIENLHPQRIHPKFRHIRGRPRQIDFVALNPRDRWLFAIETKWFPAPIQRVMNDVGRLLVLDEPGCEKFLVLAGPAGADHESCFRINMTISGNRRNVMSKFFSHKRGDSRIIKLKDQPHEIRELYRNFLVDYKLSELPNAFEIKCVDFYRSKKFAVGLWRVSLRQGTGQITRAELRAKL
jgi:hypothetical protein